MVMVAVLQISADNQQASAETFLMENGEVITGEVVDATQHAVVVRRDIGGLQQARYRDIREIQIVDRNGNLIVGELQDWFDGLYTIESDGRPVKLRGGAVLETTEERLETGPELSTTTSTSKPKAPDLPATSPERSLAPVRPVLAARSKADPSQDQVDIDRSEPGKLNVVALPANENEPYSRVRIFVDQPLDRSLAVIYTTFDGSAKAGLDYEAERGVISMRPGQTSMVVRLSLIDDELNEGEEDFILYLAVDPKQAKLDSKRIPVTIRDDE
jgi:RNase P/RNase MRP subunit p29